jgi:hypothetical protein
MLTVYGTTLIPHSRHRQDSIKIFNIKRTRGNPGGALKWSDDYNRYFEGRLVAILPDNDGPGTKHAEQVANSLYLIATEIRIVELSGLPEKGDVSDWLEAGHQASELLECIDRAAKFKPDTINIIKSEWELPAPLGQFDLPVFPLEAFPTQLCVFCTFCEAVAESFQVPVDLPAMLVLSVGGASLAKQLVVHIRGDHWEPANLFTVVALPPANRKSGVFRAVAEPLVYFERQEVERLAPMIQQNRHERSILEESLKHARKHAATAKNEEDRKHHSAASGFALGRNQNIKDRLLQIRRMFFAFAFLFAASAFGEGGEKRTTAKNRKLI